MNPRAVQQEGFTVVGIAVRTSNAQQMTEARPIGKQWERLFQDGVLAAIPNKADGNILAVYSDYASDQDGEYTYLLGARVTKVENVPAGMTAKNVPAGRYAVFTSDRGPVQKVVVDVWRRVWERDTEERVGRRPDLQNGLRTLRSASAESGGLRGGFVCGCSLGAFLITRFSR
jgi:predicted transcriptional regulator YdeE